MDSEKKRGPKAPGGSYYPDEPGFRSTEQTTTGAGNFKPFLAETKRVCQRLRAFNRADRPRLVCRSPGEMHMSGRKGDADMQPSVEFVGWDYMGKILIGT